MTGCEATEESFRVRLVSAGVCSALALAGASAGAGPAAAGGERRRAVRTPGRSPARHGRGGTEPVIIFLKNQWAGAGSRIRSGKRIALIQAAQAPYLGQLQALGATGVHGYRLVDAIAARVPASALGAIAASPGVASVIPDSPIMGPAPARAARGAAAVAARRAAAHRRRRPPRRADPARRVLRHAAA